MSDPINVVISADDRFAVGLAGTIKSALSCLAPERLLKLFVLDGGVVQANKDALARHWNDSRLSVEWVPVNRQTVSSFVVSDHITDATYYRLLAPTVLPDNLQRFIFLDADLLIRRDLGEMWDESMAGLPLLAVQDIGAPYVDSGIVLADDAVHRQMLVNERPIPNYRELSLTPSNPYFNGGVLVIDLDLWRHERLAERMLDVLAVHREHVTYWDQYALNVVLSGRWKPLNPLWNQNSYIFRVPEWLASPFCTRDCPTYATDPWIVHFNWLKPWQAQCLHPFADEYLRHLEGSPWHVTFERRPPSLSASEPTSPGPRPAKLHRRMLRSLRAGIGQLVCRRAA